MWLKLGLELHRCGDYAYWEPALTYFSEPTGKGGCRFSQRGAERSRSYIVESKGGKR